MKMQLEQIWKKERDLAIKSQDLNTFKTFYEKWKKRGFYEFDLPADIVVEISMRKMLYNLKSATEQEKADAAKWLQERGLSTDM